MFLCVLEEIVNLFDDWYALLTLDFGVGLIDSDVDAKFVFHPAIAAFGIVHNPEKHGLSFILRTDENDFRNGCGIREHSDQNFIHFGVSFEK